jgi:PleD family two-component response regulator
MSSDGINKAIRGLTTISEVYRVAPPVADDSINDEAEDPETQIDEVAADNLPVDEETSETIEADTPITVSSIVVKKIPVVENEEFSLLLIKGILEGEGYSVITARDGNEALKAVVQDSPDLIVTNYSMPGGDGIGLIKKSKSSILTSYIPIIMLTGTDEVDLEIEGLNKGADDFMVKPVNAIKLIARVNRLIRTKAN